MKQYIIGPVKKRLNKVGLFVAALLFSFYSFSQDKKVDISIDTKSESEQNFFMQPWVWIVGGAVFILLLVALLRNNKK